MPTPKRSALQQGSKEETGCEKIDEIVSKPIYRVTIPLAVISFKDEYLDLSKMSDADAERLIAKGFPHIEKI